MRKQLLGIMVSLLAVGMIAAAADTTGKGVAASARLQRLEVTHGQDGLRVEFKAEGTISPNVSTLDSPARIVVDFPNTVMATAQNHITIGRDGVKDVRIGMDAEVPHHTRVVFDLAKTCRTELVKGPNGGFVLQIHEAVTARGPAAEPATAPVPAAASTQSAVDAVAPASASPEKTGRPVDMAFVEPKYAVVPAKSDDK